MGHIGNSLSNLQLGLSTSLSEASVDAPIGGLVNASLQVFAVMSKELGHLLSTLLQGRHQVWLARSPLTETSRSTLKNVTVVPGELFGVSL